MITDSRAKRLEVVLWSIAFPGFGQLLNKKYFKAFMFVVLEVLINVGGNINDVIVSSFLLKIDEAIHQANYLWIMFYPCIYLFAIWDAYKDAGGGKHQFMYIPFVLSAYFGTLGVIFSSRFSINGHLFGPVFLSIITMVMGVMMGLIIRKLLIMLLQPG